ERNESMSSENATMTRAGGLGIVKLMSDSPLHQVRILPAPTRRIVPKKVIIVLITGTLVGILDVDLFLAVLKLPVTVHRDEVSAVAPVLQDSCGHRKVGIYKVHYGIELQITTLVISVWPEIAGDFESVVQSCNVVAG